ncbi:hypothetical protein [Bosea sp. TAF32]|uniref:hypothetical protein n=1 Tax=Bosea sp. TAF32 TaxID=3237482 RepID=UPI003F92F6EE
MSGFYGLSSDRIRHWAGNLLVVGVPALAILAVAGFGQPLFETNDDAALAMAGSGFGLAAEPEAHLTFSHIAYGVLLNALSLVFGPQAHGAATLAALALSLGLCIDVYRTSRCRNPLFFVAILSVGSAIFASAMLRPQFTITASILSASSIAAYLFHNILRRDKIDANGDKILFNIRNILIFTGIILGYAIRPSSALATLAALCPAIILLFARGSKKQRADCIRFSALILIVYGALAGVDWISYALSPAWNEVISYNMLRSLFTDFGRIQYNSESDAFRRAAWSENDYMMIQNFFSDSSIYDKSILAELTGDYAVDQIFSLSAVLAWIWAPLHWPVVYCLLAAQVALVLWSTGSRRALGLLILGQFCVIALVAVTGRPPLFRVWFAAGAVTIVFQFALIVAFGRSQSRSRWPMQAALSLFLIGCGAFGLERVISEHRADIRSAAGYRATVEEARAALDGNLVAWGDSLKWEWLVTPTRVYFPLTEFGVIPIGGYSRTPIASGAMRREGISDLSKALCTDGNIRLVAASPLIPLLSIFCAEHYGTMGTFEPIASVGGSNVYRLQLTGTAR